MPAQDLGLVRPFHIGTTPPANVLQFWIEATTDVPATQEYIAIKSYERSSENWVPITNSIDVLDILTSSSPSDALSANQGRILKGLIDLLSAAVDDVETSVGAKLNKPTLIRGTFPDVAVDTIQNNALKGVPVVNDDTMYYVELTIDDQHMDMNGLATLNNVTGIITLPAAFSSVDYKIIIWPLW